MIKQYKICSKNSTVNGSPGRDYDWSKFDWNSKTSYDFGDTRYSKYCIDPNMRGKLIGIMKAPAVFTDGDGEKYCEYLHVPYDWSEVATVYRIRPNDCMWVGKTYRGHKVIKQTAVKKGEVWYWRLKLKDKKDKGEF